MCAGEDFRLRCQISAMVFACRLDSMSDQAVLEIEEDLPVIYDPVCGGADGLLRFHQGVQLGVDGLVAVGHGCEVGVEAGVSKERESEIKVLKGVVKLATLQPFNV